MEYAAKQGLSLEEEMPYKGSDLSCPAEMSAPAGAATAAAPNLRSGAKSLAEFDAASSGGAKLGITGWRKLAENKVEPLLLALAEEGPVVVSVAAGSGWSMYSSGVMNSCPKDAVINHAVVLTGYGSDAGKLYWQIQNSWGPEWGEKGFIRMLRRDTREENEYCGWDKSPQEGTACKGGPDKVRVCGTCGVLYDSVVPKFRLSKDGWWHTNGKRSIEA